MTVVLDFWHSLYTLPEVIVPISSVHLSDTFRYFLLLVQKGLNSLESQLRLTVVLRFWHSLYTVREVIVPICGVHLSDTFRYFLLLVRRGSELFGVSVHTDSGIRILAFLLYRTRSYCAYFWCAPFLTLSGIFYSESGEGLNSLESQFTMTVLLGF